MNLNKSKIAELNNKINIYHSIFNEFTQYTSFQGTNDVKELLNKSSFNLGGDEDDKAASVNLGSSEEFSDFSLNEGYNTLLKELNECLLNISDRNYKLVHKLVNKLLTSRKINIKTEPPIQYLIDNDHNSLTSILLEVINEKIDPNVVKLFSIFNTNSKLKLEADDKVIEEVVKKLKRNSKNILKILYKICLLVTVPIKLFDNLVLNLIQHGSTININLIHLLSLQLYNHINSDLTFDSYNLEQAKQMINNLVDQIAGNYSTNSLLTLSYILFYPYYIDFNTDLLDIYTTRHFNQINLSTCRNQNFNILVNLLPEKLEKYEDKLFKLSCKLYLLTKNKVLKDKLLSFFNKFLKNFTPSSSNSLLSSSNFTITLDNVLNDIINLYFNPYLIPLGDGTCGNALDATLKELVVNLYEKLNRKSIYKFILIQIIYIMMNMGLEYNLETIDMASVKEDDYYHNLLLFLILFQSTRTCDNGNVVDDPDFLKSFVVNYVEKTDPDPSYYNLLIVYKNLLKWTANPLLSSLLDKFHNTLTNSQIRNFLHLILFHRLYDKMLLYSLHKLLKLKNDMNLNLLFLYVVSFPSELNLEYVELKYKFPRSIKTSKNFGGLKVDKNVLMSFLNLLYENSLPLDMVLYLIDELDPIDLVEMLCNNLLEIYNVYLKQGDFILYNVYDQVEKMDNKSIVDRREMLNRSNITRKEMDKINLYNNFLIYNHNLSLFNQFINIYNILLNLFESHNHSFYEIEKCENLQTQVFEKVLNLISKKLNRVKILIPFNKIAVKFLLNQSFCNKSLVKLIFNYLFNPTTITQEEILSCHPQDMKNRYSTIDELLLFLLYNNTTFDLQGFSRVVMNLVVYNMIMNDSEVTDLALFFRVLLQLNNFTYIIHHLLKHKYYDLQCLTREIRENLDENNLIYVYHIYFIIMEDEVLDLIIDYLRKSDLKVEDLDQVRFTPYINVKLTDFTTLFNHSECLKTGQTKSFDLDEHTNERILYLFVYYYQVHGENEKFMAIFTTYYIKKYASLLELLMFFKNYLSSPETGKYQDKLCKLLTEIFSRHTNITEHYRVLNYLIENFENSMELVIIIAEKVKNSILLSDFLTKIKQYYQQSLSLNDKIKSYKILLTQLVLARELGNGPELKMVIERVLNELEFVLDEDLIEITFSLLSSRSLSLIPNLLDWVNRCYKLCVNNDLVFVKILSSLLSTLDQNDRISYINSLIEETNQLNNKCYTQALYNKIDELEIVRFDEDQLKSNSDHENAYFDPLTEMLKNSIDDIKSNSEFEFKFTTGGQGSRKIKELNKLLFHSLDIKDMPLDSRDLATQHDLLDNDKENTKKSQKTIKSEFSGKVKFRTDGSTLETNETKLLRYLVINFMDCLNLNNLLPVLFNNVTFFTVTNDILNQYFIKNTKVNVEESGYVLVINNLLNNIDKVSNDNVLLYYNMYLLNKVLENSELRNVIHQLSAVLTLINEYIINIDVRLKKLSKSLVSQVIRKLDSNSLFSKIKPQLFDTFVVPNDNNLINFIDLLFNNAMSSTTKEEYSSIDSVKLDILVLNYMLTKSKRLKNMDKMVRICKYILINYVNSPQLFSFYQTFILNFFLTNSLFFNQFNDFLALINVFSYKFNQINGNSTNVPLKPGLYTVNDGLIEIYNKLLSSLLSGELIENDVNKICNVVLNLFLHLSDNYKSFLYYSIYDKLFATSGDFDRIYLHVLIFVFYNSFNVIEKFEDLLTNIFSIFQSNTEFNLVYNLIISIVINSARGADDPEPCMMGNPINTIIQYIIYNLYNIGITTSDDFDKEYVWNEVSIYTELDQVHNNITDVEKRNLLLRLLYIILSYSGPSDTNYAVSHRVGIKMGSELGDIEGYPNVIILDYETSTKYTQLTALNKDRSGNINTSLSPTHSSSNLTQPERRKVVPLSDSVKELIKNYLYVYKFINYNNNNKPTAFLLNVILNNVYYNTNVYNKLQAIQFLLSILPGHNHNITNCILDDFTKPSGLESGIDEVGIEGVMISKVILLHKLLSKRLVQVTEKIVQFLLGTLNLDKTSKFSLQLLNYLNNNLQPDELEESIQPLIVDFDSVEINDHEEDENELLVHTIDYLLYNLTENLNNKVDETSDLINSLFNIINYNHNYYFKYIFTNLLYIVKRQINAANDQNPKFDQILHVLIKLCGIRDNLILDNVDEFLSLLTLINYYQTFTPNDLLIDQLLSNINDDNLYKLLYLLIQKILSMHSKKTSKANSNTKMYYLLLYKMLDNQAIVSNFLQEYVQFLLFLHYKLDQTSKFTQERPYLNDIFSKMVKLYDKNTFQLIDIIHNTLSQADFTISNSADTKFEDSDFQVNVINICVDHINTMNVTLDNEGKGGEGKQQEFKKALKILTIMTKDGNFSESVDKLYGIVIRFLLYYVNSSSTNGINHHSQTTDDFSNLLLLLNNTINAHHLDEGGNGILIRQLLLILKKISSFNSVNALDHVKLVHLSEENKLTSDNFSQLQSDQDKILILIYKILLNNKNEINKFLNDILTSQKFLFQDVLLLYFLLNNSGMYTGSIFCFRSRGPSSYGWR